MTKYLPPDVKQLFVARPVPEVLRPEKRARHPPLEGVSAFLHLLPGLAADPGATPKNNATEQVAQRRERLRLAKEQKHKEDIRKAILEWKPLERDEKRTSDAFRTILVCRLAYSTTDDSLRKAFERFGRIKTVRVIKNLEGQSRGYGFVEFEDERDWRRAYDRANDMEVDGRRVRVDVERGRTVPDWRPRRFGGGLGSSRKARPKGFGKQTALENARKGPRSTAPRFDGGGSARPAGRIPASSSSSSGPPSSGSGFGKGSFSADGEPSRKREREDDRDRSRRDDGRGAEGDSQSSVSRPWDRDRNQPPNQMQDRDRGSFRERTGGWRRDDRTRTGANSIPLGGGGGDRS